MIEVIENILRIMESVPLGVWAILAGTGISWGVTQRAKFLIPFHFAFITRHLLTQTIAFVLGWGTCWALWPTFPGFVAAVLVGIWSPWSYNLFMRWIAFKWPALRESMSQDVRP